MTEWIYFSVLLFVALIVGVVSFSFGFFRHNIQKIFPHISGFSVFTGILIFFLSQLIVFPFLLYLFLLIFPMKTTIDMRGWFGVMGITFASSLTLIYFYTLPRIVRDEILWRWWGKRHGRMENMLFGMGAWFVAFPFVIVSVNLVKMIFDQFFTIPNIQQLPVQDLMRVRHNQPLFTSLAFCIVVIVPIVEELLFRGMLQTWLRKSLRWKWSVAVTSVIFASLHLSPDHGMRNVEFFTGIFVLSLFLGYLYEKQGALWTPIGLHIAFNGMSTLMLTLEIS